MCAAFRCMLFSSANSTNPRFCSTEVATLCLPVDSHIDRRLCCRSLSGHFCSLGQVENVLQLELLLPTQGD